MKEPEPEDKVGQDPCGVGSPGKPKDEDFIILSNVIVTQEKICVQNVFVNAVTSSLCMDVR